ncbi:MAG: GYD domain-containing protein [Actinomycetota bacterium]
MPRYLWQVSYSPEGMKGVLKEGGTARREMVEKLVANLGGTVETFYFAFGEDDVYLVAEFPDNVTAAAVSMTVGASGAASAKTVVLLSPEEIDAASKKTVDYRAPGK